MFSVGVVMGDSFGADVIADGTESVGVVGVPKEASAGGEGGADDGASDVAGVACGGGAGDNADGVLGAAAAGGCSSRFEDGEGVGAAIIRTPRLLASS
jgi:hypothetical protein